MDADGVVAETTVVAVTTAVVAAQAAEEPQAYAENLATCGAVMKMFGVNAQNYCASAVRRRDTISSIDRARRAR